MNQKLYYIAYKFLKIRATKGNPFATTEKLNKEDKEKVFGFLSYNHQVKFI
jgi:hypothetical protein